MKLNISFIDDEIEKQQNKSSEDEYLVVINSFVVLVHCRPFICYSHYCVVFSVCVPCSCVPCYITCRCCGSGTPFHTTWLQVIVVFRFSQVNQAAFLPLGMLAARMSNKEFNYVKL